MNDPLFKITTPEGHEFKIYRDGITEGFPDGSSIVNMIPFLEWHATRDQMQANAERFNHPLHDEIFKTMIASVSKVAEEVK